MINIKTMIRILAFTLLAIGFSNWIQAQSTPASEVASKIATKMKDTLNLTDSARFQIYNINMLLHEQKTAVRQSYTNMDTVRTKIQQIESTRDSLYRAFLSSEQYLLYQEKKTNLVNNNN
jgi:hypothetical protein